MRQWLGHALAISHLLRSAGKHAEMGAYAVRQAAPSRIIQSILRAHGGLKDDTSIVVVDVMPPGKNFAQCSASGAGGGGGGCFCM